MNTVRFTDGAEMVVDLGAGEGNFVTGIRAEGKWIYCPFTCPGLAAELVIRAERLGIKTRSGVVLVDSVLAPQWARVAA